MVSPSSASTSSNESAHAMYRVNNEPMFSGLTRKRPSNDLKNCLLPEKPSRSNSYCCRTLPIPYALRIAI